MKSELGRAARVTAILVLVVFAAAARARAQDVPLPLASTQTSLTAVPGTPGPAIGEQFTELSSGLFTYSKTDLSLPGPMPINVTRVYRSSDKQGGIWYNRAFGLGTRLNYDIFIYSDGTNEHVSMPDSSSLTCTPFGSQYVCNSQPSGVWFGSVINGSTLTRPDGTEYQFNTSNLLTSITDRWGNQVTITRGGTENSACNTGGWHGQLVPSGYVGTVSSSNGRAVYFCYDDSSNPYDITGIADNATGGPIKKVTYTYGGNSQLQTVTQANSSEAVTTYQYNQTSPSGIGNITTIIVNDECNNQTCGSPNQVYTYITYVTNGLGTALQSISSQLPGNGYQYGYHSPSAWPASHVTVTLPDNAVRDFYFDSNGYVTEDARNVGKSSVSPEYTVFKRGQQTVGTSGEFVGEVDEEDNSQNIVRKTTYNYDTTAGTVLGVTLSPAPGKSSCCSTSATWNYTYTTYNRLLTAVEPLAYNGVGTTYAYVDPPNSPSMTVTDPLDRVTTVDYNAQGQPISVTDPMHNPSTTIQYYSSGCSSGDLKSITDPMQNSTTYVTDCDGRVTSVTSPKQETTQYSYDAIDDVTEVIDPMTNITCNTYDLLGELATTTPPRGVNGSCTNLRSGYTTTVTRSPNLANTTVTDPLGYTTVTNLDGQGRKTDYTDKRGIKTTYTFDLFGRVTEALFNSNSKSGYSQDAVTMLFYDALDRVGVLEDSLSGSSLNYAYDALDSVLSEGDVIPNTNGSYITNYGYDSNGRRISLQPTMNGVGQPIIRYGYDCADELIGISNNGTWAPPNCSPSTFVNYNNNVSTSTQVGINYDADGNPADTVVDGVETTVTLRDSDERVKAETFQAYSSRYSYGNLTYQYDADGHVIDKGGSLAAVSIPPAASATYSTTDQLLTWNRYGVSTDNASNITYEPASGFTYGWTARNQMGSVTGASEVYDGLGRREQSTSSGGDTLNFLHDDGSVLGWLDSLGNYWDFLNLPGGGALAGSNTVSGTTTTWVPLIDASGSTIALVNAASTGSVPATTYTYDPFGNTTASGSASTYPFLYQGMEKELTDPGPLYYSGGGQYYSPQIMRSPSETSQTSSQGNNGGPAGNGIAGPSGGGFSPNFSPSLQEGGEALGVGAGAAGATAGFIAAYNTFLVGAEGASLGYATPVVIVGLIAEGLFVLFDDLFGGSSSAPPTPRQLMHARHPLYPVILGVSDGLIPSEKSEGLKVCGDPYPSSGQPLQKKSPAPGSTPTPPPAAPAPWLPPLTNCEEHALCSCSGGFACAFFCSPFHELPPVMFGCDFLCFERQEHLCDQEYPCKY